MIDLLVISTSKWGEKFERTEQLMVNYARSRRVFYFEPPSVAILGTSQYLIRQTRDDVFVIETYLPENLSVFEQKTELENLLKQVLKQERIQAYSVWTDTPRSIPLIRTLNPEVFMYDCQRDDSISHPELESELFQRANIVFVSQTSLYGVKRERHNNIHLQPSALDYRHFYQGRRGPSLPNDLVNTSAPRIGYFGPLDHNLNYELIRNLADIKPEWTFILAGEIKIDPSLLPLNKNIVYLEEKSYAKLPTYLGNIDVTWLPFQVNETTSFLNPELISQSLVAGCPVVTSSLPDVLRTFDDLVRVAEVPRDTLVCLEEALKPDRNAWLERVDHFFRGQSWEITCERLCELEQDVITQKAEASQRRFQQLLKQLLPEKNLIHKMGGSLLGRLYGDRSHGTRETYHRK